jgi:hypothetical protein
MSLEIVYLINIGVGLLIAVLAIPLILEKIKPNMWYGFKTRKTLSDEKIWYPANKYAGKVMVITGLFIAVVSAVILLLTVIKPDLISWSDDVHLIVILIVSMVPILIMLVVSLLHLRKY